MLIYWLTLTEYSSVCLNIHLFVFVNAGCGGRSWSWDNDVDLSTAFQHTHKLCLITSLLLVTRNERLSDPVIWIRLDSFFQLSRLPVQAYFQNDQHVSSGMSKPAHVTSSHRSISGYLFAGRNAKLHCENVTRCPVWSFAVVMTLQEYYWLNPHS